MSSKTEVIVVKPTDKGYNAKKKNRNRNKNKNNSKQRKPRNPRKRRTRMRQGYNAPSNQARTEIFRERIGTVTSSIDYVPSSQGVNAGLAQFNHLSKIAQGYEKYRFKKLIYKFVPSINPYNANSNGEVAMYFDSDPRDGAPDDFTDFVNNTSAKKTVPYKPMSCAVSSLLRTQNAAYLVRTGPKANLENYDIGRFHWATSGQNSDGAVIGHIEVEYVCELFSPQTEGNLETVLSYSRFQSYQVSPQVGWTGVTFGILDTNKLDIRQVGTKFYLPKGQWRVDYTLYAVDSLNADSIAFFGAQFLKNGSPYAPISTPYFDQGTTNRLTSLSINQGTCINLTDIDFVELQYIVWTTGNVNITGEIIFTPL